MYVCLYVVLLATYLFQCTSLLPFYVNHQVFLASPVMSIYTCASTTPLLLVLCLNNLAVGLFLHI